MNVEITKTQIIPTITYQYSIPPQFDYNPQLDCEEIVNWNFENKKDKKFLNEQLLRLNEKIIDLF